MPSYSTTHPTGFQQGVPGRQGARRADRLAGTGCVRPCLLRLLPCKPVARNSPGVLACVAQLFLLAVTPRQLISYCARVCAGTVSGDKGGLAATLNIAAQVFAPTPTACSFCRTNVMLRLRAAEPTSLTSCSFSSRLLLLLCSAEILDSASAGRGGHCRPLGRAEVGTRGWSSLLAGCFCWPGKAPRCPLAFSPCHERTCPTVLCTQHELSCSLLLTA